MAKFKSKPHEIEAFQFRNDVKITTPKWFAEAYERGEVQITMNNKDNYITVFGDQQMEKAFLTYWVCRADHGKIYVLDDASFKESYYQ